MRIFFDVPDGADFITITGEDFSHLFVLRVREGEAVSVSNMRGLVYDGKIASITKNSITVALSSAQPSQNEPKTSITLYQALCKGDKNEFIIQKSVELGISRIVFFSSENCVAKADGREAAKLERFNKIARQAAMQCRRDIIPSVDGVISFEAMASALKSSANPLFFYENAQFGLSEHLSRITDISEFAFAVGSEGGFTESEAKHIEKLGIPPISLGKRILRAETAPLCALSVIMARVGEI